MIDYLAGLTCVSCDEPHDTYRRQELPTSFRQKNPGYTDDEYVTCPKGATFNERHLVEYNLILQQEADRTEEVDGSLETRIASGRHNI